MADDANRAGGGHQRLWDGLSNTILAGEKHLRLGTLGAYPADMWLYNGDDLANHVRGGGQLEPIARSTTDDTDCVVHSLSPLDVPSYCENFGSWHPGMCQFVFCDGSVHSVQTAIDLETLRRLVNRRDREPIAGNAF